MGAGELVEINVLCQRDHRDLRAIDNRQESATEGPHEGAVEAKTARDAFDLPNRIVASSSQGILLDGRYEAR